MDLGRSHLIRAIQQAALLMVVLGAFPRQGQAQEIRGQIVDSSTGWPVHTAGVFLLDEDRRQVALSVADSLGRYVVRAPGAGVYYLYVQRIGYYEVESPLVAASDGATYELDLEIRAEPIALDPLLVTVRNEQMERWLTLRLGGNPNELLGYRAIQGIRLETAKLKSDDNTELLRWLFIPVSHGIDVCLGSERRRRMPQQYVLKLAVHRTAT